MKNNFVINLDNKSTAMTIAIVIGLVLAVLVVSASWIVYYWYVVAYAFNHVIAPIFGTQAITIWMAGALSSLVGLFFIDIRYHINELSKQTKTWLLYPFLTHLVIWLLVG